jgi:hypothetical protein
MNAAIRTVAKEMQNLMAGLGRKGAKHAGAEATTERVVKDVLGRDGLKLGTKAKLLANLEVKAKGEGAKQLAFPLADVAVDDAARFATNRAAGDKREAIVETILSALFPKREGYVVKGEQYLRDRHGKIALDRETGQSRRIDFAVFKGSEVVKLLEVTSEKVNKAFQLAKEGRMRRHGGRYMLHPTTGERLRIPAEIKTAVIRLP